MGVAQVTQEAYADPTAKDGDWSVVDLKPVKALKTPVTLEVIKGDSALGEILLVRQSRLSVMPVTAREFKRVLKLGGTSL